MQNPTSPSPTTGRYQKLLDDLTPFTTQRWIGTGILGVLYIIRAVTANAFLTPKFDPALEQELNDAEDDGPMLPTKVDDEFRPFIRRLPEFKFWYVMLILGIILPERF
ncbi:hypothetical protein HK103_005943 [Boothiomyces macroporosus]|uniref:Uncharacterized protein n=1 Tax=Boothiomyces macroporosus TaxID=261099 RepID=A0AAD5UNF8_9FUNG|nr:hypothetical protein HK103_005943 [Boothiomyces macroporosus]